ncbi:ATP-binding protein [Geothrix sp. SG200]|uniref:ATP-binding protein n=1 Tax=Geothrix sp. SG200 TaxID=2922865 RepID=UPI002435E5E6|nr:ATP-binding protein [Geothrix sp. SG200]
MTVFLSRFRIATKLWLGYSAVAAILTGLALIQLGLLHQEEQQAIRVFENRMVPVRHLKVVSDAYSIRILFAARQVRGGTLDPAEGLAQVRSARREAGRHWAEFKASAPAQTDAEALARVDHLSLYLAADLDRLEGLLAESRLPELGRFVDDDLLPQILPMTNLLAGLVQAQEDAAQQSLEAMAARARRTRVLSYAMILAGLVTALGLGYLIARDLSVSIRGMLTQVRRAAEGDLTARVEVRGRDELADLGHELNRMVARLRETIQALAEQEAGERAVLQNAQVAVIVRDRDGLVRRFNPYAETLLGYRADEVLGQPSANWLDPEEVAARAGELARTAGRPVVSDLEIIRLLTEAGPDQREWTFRARDGRRIPMLVALSQVTGPEGEPMGYLSVASDLSERKALEAGLRASEAKAQAANRAKSAFLSNMSHELRTPLNAILGYAQLMARRSARSPEDHEQLGRILAAGEHLLSLINDVLSLSKIESGGLELRPEPFGTAALLEGVVDMQRIRAEAKGLALRLEVDPALPPHLEGDAPKLRQVLVNLLGNAVKFTRQGSVTLRAGYVAGRATFAVEDTGPGISEEDQRQLFQAFFQASTQPLAAEGTGLGLHISRSLVHLMGGELHLQSRLGEGSRFSFELPMEEAEPPLELTGGGQVVGLARGQRRPAVLVVDDRPENRDLLAQLLASVGFQVRTAADGVEALELWERHHPDLIWMDLRMPRMSGFEALQVLRGKELEQGLPHTFVVAISASVIDLDRETLRKAGFDDFLGKPFREAQLFEVAGRLLGLRFLTREPEAPSTPGDLAGLQLQPESWRASLKEAVVTGDTEVALALVEGLGHGALAEDLRRLLKAYKLEALLDALNR